MVFFKMLPHQILHNFR